MCSKQNKLRIVILTIAIFLANYTFAVKAENLSVVQQEKRGWDTLSGILTAVEKSAVAGAQSKEVAVVTDDGTVVILIGDPVTQLADKIGSAVTVTGVYKSSLRVKNGLLPVLEVRVIDEQE